MLSHARRLVLVLVAALSATLLIGAPAHAHAELKSVSPADAATLTQAPRQVVLTFNEDIGEVGAAVSVVDSEGVSVADGKPLVAGTTVTQALQGTLHSGSFQVNFRVVSADGHPVSGTSTFTLDLPTASATQAPTPSDSASASVSATEPEPTMTALDESPSAPAAAATSTGQEPAASSNTGLIAGLIALAVIVLGGLGFALRKRSSTPKRTH